MEEKIPIINGSNNVINIASGNISQSDIVINSNVTKSGVSKITDDLLLIDTTKSLDECNLAVYHHWVCKITLNGKPFSPQSLFRKLNEFSNNHFKKQVLSILSFGERHTTSNSIQLKFPLKDAGAINHYKEIALSIRQNELQFEFAQYKSKDYLLTDFNQEFLPSYLLLCFCKTLFPQFDYDIDFSIRISTTGKLNFVTNNNFFSIQNTLDTYVLDNATHNYQTKIKNFNDETIIELMQGVIECFCGESKHNKSPFLVIDEANQSIAIEYIGKHI